MMKKIILLFTSIILPLLYSYNIKAQEMIDLNQVKYFGEESDFSIGIHTGFFDSNQSIKFPFNIGILTQFNYIPDVSKRWFIGAEIGGFFTTGGIDKLGRTTKTMIADITIYPGYSIPINSKISYEDNLITRLKKEKIARKLKIGLGFAIAIPIQKKSYGSGVNNEAVNTGIGFSLRTSYDLPNRIALFGNITRIGKDLDGYAYLNNGTSERSPGNKHLVTYIFKLGILWNFLKK